MFKKIKDDAEYKKYILQDNDTLNDIPFIESKNNSFDHRGLTMMELVAKQDAKFHRQIGQLAQDELKLREDMEGTIL